MTQTFPSGRLLLDTHVLLWWLTDGPELSDDLKNQIDTELEVFVSAATIWEISIKASAGKLSIPSEFPEVMRDSGIGELPIRYHHAYAAGRLPLLHRDPFDRMLIAQALTDRLTLVTRDAAIHQYDLPLIKA